MEGISKEKLEWMEEVGIKKFDKPMMYFDSKGSMIYSEEYIKENSLEVLKAKYDMAYQKELRDDTKIVFDKGCECEDMELDTMQELEEIVSIAKEKELALGILVSMKGFEKPELIINPTDNLNDKLEYWKKTYDDNLKHRHAEGIEIVGYTFQ